MENFPMPIKTKSTIKKNDHHVLITNVSEQFGEQNVFELKYQKYKTSLRLGTYIVYKN